MPQGIDRGLLPACRLDNGVLVLRQMFAHAFAEYANHQLRDAAIATGSQGAHEVLPEHSHVGGNRLGVVAEFWCKEQG